MRDYKELDVWQRAVDLATELYRLTERFPQAEKFGLVSQIRRAVTSVPANIAEGWGRGSTKEYVQFLLVARGSPMELETHLIIANRLNYLAQQELAKVQADREVISKMLNGLVGALRARQRGSHPGSSC